MITHQSGEFNTRVLIEQLDTGTDAYGAPLKTWNAVPFATWWCRINPISGNESYSNQAIEADAKLKMDGQYISGVTAKMRVNDHGTLYAITSPPLNWDNRRVYMTLLAKTWGDRV